MESENISQFRNIKTHISDQSIRLPEEIIEEILSRLPVKSLLKFRCVSKPWRSLIGSKRFTKKHLDYSRKNSNFAHHCIISKSIGPHSEIRQCSLRSMLDDPFTDQFKSCNFTSICPTCVVGCCNGLVCILLESRHFMLWNPSTKMKKNLPAFDRKINHGRIQCYGFGFDELSGDYMVFGILSIFCVTGRYEAIAKVYSLERNSWELVKYKYVSAFGEGGKYASGKLHWHGTMRVAWDIASFDLSSLEFILVEQPSYPSPDCGFNESMGVIGGCLSMLYDYKAHLDIWIMKEYGLRESWDKVVTVTLVDNPMERLALFAIGPSGEIILMYESNYVIYYPEDNGYRHCQVKNLAPLRGAGIYAESLVTLVPYDEE